MFSKIRAKLQWRQARQKIAEQQPLMIGVTGSVNTALASEAIGLVLQDNHTIHISRVGRSFPPEITGANVVIGNIAVEKPGDMDAISGQLPWQIVVATNIASKNIEQFGSKEMIAHEYTSLVSVLPKTAHAILNADDELVANMAYHTTATVTLYGSSPRAQVRLIRSTRNSRGGFVAEVAIDGHHFQLPLPKIFAFSQIYPVLAALAVCRTLGESVPPAVTVLAEIHPPQGELSLVPTLPGARILDATADATPEAMLSALHALRSIPGKRRIAILGDISDLGNDTVSTHKRIGKAAAENVHIFIAVGELMRYAGAEALKRRPGPDVHHFQDGADVIEWLSPYLTPEDIILVSGSPRSGVDKIVEKLSQY